MGGWVSLRICVFLRERNGFSSRSGWAYNHVGKLDGENARERDRKDPERAWGAFKHSPSLKCQLKIHKPKCMGFYPLAGGKNTLRCSEEALSPHFGSAYKRSLNP